MCHVLTLYHLREPQQTIDPHAGERAYELILEPEALAHACHGGACAPHAAVVAELRRSAMRFIDFWIALAPLRTQADERRCA